MKEISKKFILSLDGSIRDYTDLLLLVILSNLENINAELIEVGIPQSERLVKLNDMERNAIIKEE